MSSFIPASFLLESVILPILRSWLHQRYLAMIPRRIVHVKVVVGAIAFNGSSACTFLSSRSVVDFRSVLKLSCWTTGGVRSPGVSERVEEDGGWIDWSNDDETMSTFSSLKWPVMCHWLHCYMSGMCLCLFSLTVCVMGKLATQLNVPSCSKQASQHYTTKHLAYSKL